MNYFVFANVTGKNKKLFIAIFYRNIIVEKVKNYFFQRMLSINS